MQSFESPSLSQNQSVERDESKELSPDEQALIRDMMDAESGHAMALPGGDVLYTVQGPRGKQLEWTAGRNGEHRGDFTIRDQFDKRVVFESKDGIHWKNAEGQSWEMDGSGVPAAVFDEVKPFFSSQDE